MRNAITSWAARAENARAVMRIECERQGFLYHSNYSTAGSVECGRVSVGGVEERLA